MKKNGGKKVKSNQIKNKKNQKATHTHTHTHNHIQQTSRQ